MQREVGGARVGGRGAHRMAKAVQALLFLLLTIFVAPAPAQVLSAGTHTLPSTSLGELRILMAANVPLARSYDGHAWELTQAGAADRFVLSCDHGACSVTVPGGHRIEQYDGPTISAAGAASRFLTQATFGPTRAGLQAGLDATSTPSVRSWIDAQMAEAPTSHRVYYRRPCLHEPSNRGRLDSTALVLARG